MRHVWLDYMTSPRSTLLIATLDVTQCVWLSEHNSLSMQWDTLYSQYCLHLPVCFQYASRMTTFFLVSHQCHTIPNPCSDCLTSGLPREIRGPRAKS